MPADVEFVEQLLRKRAELVEQYARSTANYERQIHAIDTLLAEEGHKPGASRQLDLARRSGTVAARRERELMVARERERRELERRELERARVSKERYLSSVRRKQSETDQSATTREVVHSVLEAVGQPMKMADVVETAAAVIGSQANEDTIRSVLQRMVHSGEATKVDRGMYTLAGRPRSEGSTPEESAPPSYHAVEVEPG